jgi:asparagine synthase (glutamine-hydrolysing)
LGRAVEKRVLVTDRPIACLLSGGLDSSLITALVNEYHHNISDEPLETYSIGLEGSEDLRCAKIVADYLGTKHTEIVLTEQEFLDAIPQVIYAIESYDTTTVRASIGNWLLGKYISEHSDAKVIFNGDGSDELAGGYLYMNYAPDNIEFDKESRRLLSDNYLFDVLRSDKSISSNGLEPRTPFLDRAFTNYVLSIPPYFRNHKNFSAPEKNLLRTAFSSTYFLNNEGKQLLPNDILWRKKEAFSDGVSSHGRS